MLGANVEKSNNRLYHIHTSSTTALTSATFFYLFLLQLFIDKHTIAADDLVTMRRHGRTELYLDSFKSCVRRMQETPAEEVQISLFPPSADALDDDFDDYMDEMEMTM